MARACWDWGCAWIQGRPLCPFSAFHPKCLAQQLRPGKRGRGSSLVLGPADAGATLARSTPRPAIPTRPVEPREAQAAWHAVLKRPQSPPRRGGQGEGSGARWLTWQRQRRTGRGNPARPRGTVWKRRAPPPTQLGGSPTPAWAEGEPLPCLEGESGCTRSCPAQGEP